jgi:hypothetical protein
MANSLKFLSIHLQIQQVILSGVVLKESNPHGN